MRWKKMEDAPWMHLCGSAGTMVLSEMKEFMEKVEHKRHWQNYSIVMRQHPSVIEDGEGASCEERYYEIYICT